MSGAGEQPTPEMYERGYDSTFGNTARAEFCKGCSPWECGGRQRRLGGSQGAWRWPSPGAGPCGQCCGRVQGTSAPSAQMPMPRMPVMPDRPTHPSIQQGQPAR